MYMLYLGLMGQNNDRYGNARRAFGNYIVDTTKLYISNTRHRIVDVTQNKNE